MSCILYPDCLFSNWIFVWYILFICRITKKFNPIYFLSFALFVNFLQIIIKFLTKNSLENILVFITIITILKIIPLITIINNERNVNDILFGLVLFIIYIIYMCINYYYGRIKSEMLEFLYVPDNQRKCKTFFETLPATFRWFFT